MTKQDTDAPSPRAIDEAFTQDELRALAQHIIESGVLGRSRHYIRLLEYLVLCAIENKSPKEIELAIDALGRADDFDVSADSTVRVYIHQLRKKLDKYYEKFEREARFRIVIPRGKYTLAALPLTREPAGPVVPLRPPFRFGLNTGLLVLATVLLALNLFFIGRGDDAPVAHASQLAAAHPVWGKVLHDDKPILLVMGDYYIFGELNANGNVARMVREFNVNSPRDLEELQFSDITRAEHYLDLDLSYMPEGSAYALARIVPILQESGKPVNITMMSDLTTAEIRSNHIVYVGYISALDKLKEMTFTGSGLQIGRSYDELFNVDTAEYYTSDAGLPEEGEPFRDYGLFATFPASSDTRVILITGMRDAGLMHTAQALSDVRSLDDLVIAIDSDTDEAVASFEALYEVYGLDRLNFDANLVYARMLDSRRIWGSPQAGL